MYYNSDVKLLYRRMLLTAEKFANIYLSVSIVIFAVGMLFIEQRHEETSFIDQQPEEETIVIEMPCPVTPGVQNLCFAPKIIIAGE